MARREHRSPTPTGPARPDQGPSEPEPAPLAGPRPATPLLPLARPELDDLEVSGLRLLAAGLPADVLTLVQSSGRTDLVAQLLVADAQVRAVELDVPSVQAIAEHVHRLEPPGSRLRPWASAMLAERLVIEADEAGLLVAREALEELRRQTVPVLPPVALRYARARLLRIEAAAWMFVPRDQGFSSHLARRDQAIADLLACGFTEEVHLTRGTAAGLLANVLLEDINENHERLVDARKALDDSRGSLWAVLLDSMLAVSSFEVGDMVGALEAYERVDKARYRILRLEVIPRYGRAFFRLVTAGASPQTVEGIERALADVRRHDPRTAQHWYGHVTHTLADLGSRAAAHFARLEAELPAQDPVSRAERRVLSLRVDALAGEPVALDEIMRTLERLERAGRRRKSARAAVRLGHDLVVGGDPDTAEAVHRWGLDRLPPPARRTVWETAWARPLGRSRLSVPRLALPGGRPSAASPRTMARQRDAAVRTGGGGRSVSAGRRGLAVRVLAPTVEVDVDGRPATLSDAQAKLLLALVVSHPAPLHVERASDVLWPDEPLSVTRPRLNSLVHRLRRVLHPFGDAVSRTGALLRLDEERCHVDLWWFQQALTGSPDQRRQALLSVRGNLGDAQFPYEEGFFDERHRVSGEWVRHACRAQRGGEVAMAELEPALTSLKLTAEDLDFGGR